MIISSAPWRIPASCALGNPLCCFAYGKMAYISRSKSLSVRTVPFTLATGFPVGCSVAVWKAEVFAPVVGACEATWATACVIVAAIMSAVKKWYFIIPLSLGPQKRGKGFPFPRFATGLYWKTVGMLLLLLASFASPKWH